MWVVGDGAALEVYDLVGEGGASPTLVAGAVDLHAVRGDSTPKSEGRKIYERDVDAGVVVA